MLYCCVFSEYFSQDLFEVTYIDVIFFVVLVFLFLVVVYTCTSTTTIQPSKRQSNADLSFAAALPSVVWVHYMVHTCSQCTLFSCVGVFFDGRSVSVYLLFPRDDSLVVLPVVN